MNEQGADPVIVVNALRKTYGDTDAVAGITFAVQRGEVFGLLGPNGSGKSTTLETIVGLRRPSSGSVRVLGMDPAQDRRGVTERVAVQPQAAALFPTLTVLETVQLFAAFYAHPREVDAVIEEIELQDARHTRVKHLSGGQERRLLIGIALVGNPEVLVLDEPSAGLDPSARHNLWAIIERQRTRGATVLLSTHHMDEATTVCDRLAILVDGRIAAAGEPEVLIRELSTTSTVSFTLPAKHTEAQVRALDLGGEATVVATPAGLRVTVATEDADAVLRRVTFSPGITGFDYSVKHGSLEDVFIDVSHTAH